MSSFSIDPLTFNVVDKNKPLNNLVVNSFLFDNSYYLSICCEKEYIKIKEINLNDIYIKFRLFDKLTNIN